MLILPFILDLHLGRSIGHECWALKCWVIKFRWHMRSRSSRAHLLDGLRIKCTWIRLAVRFHLRRYLRKLLAKFLLCVIAVLKFQRVFCERFFDFFRVHFGVDLSDRAATPNDPKLSDSGPGARVGARRREAKARAVPGFMAGRTARD